MWGEWPSCQFSFQRHLVCLWGEHLDWIIPSHDLVQWFSTLFISRHTGKTLIWSRPSVFGQLTRNNVLPMGRGVTLALLPKFPQLTWGPFVAHQCTIVQWLKMADLGDLQWCLHYYLILSRTKTWPEKRCLVMGSRYHYLPLNKCVGGCIDYPLLDFAHSQRHSLNTPHTSELGLGQAPHRPLNNLSN